MKQKTEKIASFTRTYRKLHRWIAVPLFLFLFLIGLTGLLLGWKKATGLLPETSNGTSTEIAQWLPIDSLSRIAGKYALDSLNESPEIDRIDIRPKKAVAKIVFAHHFTELQLDCYSGKILSVSTRYSDIIEKIHDGSIVDMCFDTANDYVKLTYTTLVSSGLILLSLSGFWLWYNPKRIRKIKSGNVH